MASKAASPQIVKNVYTTLKNELPSLFRSKHCFEMYSPNVTFIDKIRNKKIEGLSRYVIEGSLLHIYFNLRYKYIQLKVLNSSFDDQDRSISVRWRLMGVKGFSIFVGYFSKEFNRETCSLWLDGHSKFELDNEGKIFKHTCDKVIIEGGLEKLASNGKVLTQSN